MNQILTKMHSSRQAQFQAQARKKHQIQLIQINTSSQTTQTSHHPIPVFGSNRLYNLRRNNHLALARGNSPYNLLQTSEKEEQLKVFIYFTLDYFPDPNLTTDTTETDHDESFADSQATRLQSENQSLTDFTFDLSETIIKLIDDANSPVYTPPILDFTGETSYQCNSINNIYQYNTTSSSDVQLPSSDENNEHFFIGGNITQIERNESKCYCPTRNPKNIFTISSKIIKQRNSEPWPVLQNRRRNVTIKLQGREINNKLHQIFGFEDDKQ